MSLSRALYSLLVALALPWLSLLYLWRGLSDRAYLSGWGARFGLGPALAGEARSLWVHAVSVGEVQAAGALLEALREQYPARPMVITCATPAGRERARALAQALARSGADPDSGASAGAGVDVRYAPYDLGACVRGALRRLRPAMLVIMETELWPNLLNECARAGVPVLIASARLSGRSLGRLKKFPGLLQPALRTAVTVAAQTPADAQRFAALGLPPERSSVCGNIKFDRTPGASLRTAAAAVRARYAPARLLWVAGSTHQGEEQAALDAHQAVRNSHADALLVLAPRHRPRFDEVAAILERSGLSWLRYSAASGASAAACHAVAVLLLDTIGDLENFYAAADLAFVGGSLVPVGGHNLLEPAALGVPTITGPCQSAAPQVAQELSARGAVRIVATAADLSATVVSLLGDTVALRALSAAALATVAANRGALQRLLGQIRESLGSR